VEDADAAKKWHFFHSKTGFLYNTETLFDLKNFNIEANIPDDRTTTPNLNMEISLMAIQYKRLVEEGRFQMTEILLYSLT